MRMTSLLVFLALIYGADQAIATEKNHRKDNCSPSKSKVSEWTRWGFNNENTFANLQEKQINKGNVAQLVELWNFVLPNDDAYQVEPIVVDKLLYILSVKGYLYVINTEDGTFYQKFNGGNRLFIGSKDDNNAGSTPVVHGKNIYTATDDMLIRSFNRFTGAQNPHWPAEGVKVPVYPGTPQADEQGAIQTSLTILKEGKKGILFISTSSLDEGTEITVQKGTQNAYDLKGNLLWSQVIAGANDDAMGTNSWSTPAFDIKNKLMFFGTSNPQKPPAGIYSDAMQARNYLTGKLVWNYQFVANDVASIEYPYGIGNPMYLVDKDLGGSPNVFDVQHQGKTKPLVGVNGKDAIYRAFDRKSGKLAWAATLTFTPAANGNPSAAYAKGVLYTACTSDILPATTLPNPPFSPIYGNAYPVQAATYADFIKAVAFGDEAASIRVHKGFLTSKGIVTALDAATGEVKWQKIFPTIIYATPVYANGILYVGFYNGTLRALDTKNGNELATFLTPASNIPSGFSIPLPANQTIPAPVSVVNGKIFVPYINAILPGNSGVFALGLPEINE